jgi:hypothetical protein
VTGRCIRVLVAIGVLGLAAVTPRADAALCRTKRGAVFVRDACKRKETALDLVAVGAGASKGDPGQKGASFPRLRAFDASGTPLPGHLTGRGELVILRGTRALHLRVGVNGFQPSGRFYFDAMSCAGQRLVLDEGFLIDSTTATFAGTSAYYAGEPVQQHATQSQLYDATEQECTSRGGTYDATIGFCCGNFTEDVPAGPAMPIDLSAFQPPFRVVIER